MPTEVSESIGISKMDDLLLFSIVNIPGCMKGARNGYVITYRMNLNNVSDTCLDDDDVMRILIAL